MYYYNVQVFELQRETPIDIVRFFRCSSYSAKHLHALILLFFFFFFSSPSSSDRLSKKKTYFQTSHELETWHVH